MFSPWAAAGAIARRITVRAPRCTIVSIAGPGAATGERCWPRWPRLDGPRRGGHRQHLRQGASLGTRRQRGAKAQAIGPSRGGQTTKIHALIDVLGRPGVLLLAPGNASDVRTAPEVLAKAHGRIRRPSADKGYDADRLRVGLRDKGITLIIARKRGRKRKIRHDKRRYRERARRGHPLPPEGLPSHSHPLRQARPQLCPCPRAGRHHRLLVLTAHRRSTAIKVCNGWLETVSFYARALLSSRRLTAIVSRLG